MTDLPLVRYTWSQWLCLFLSHITHTVFFALMPPASQEMDTDAIASCFPLTYRNLSFPPHHNKISLLPCSKPGIKSLLCFASTGQAESSMFCYKDTRAICLPVHIDNDMCLDTTICWFPLLWFSYILLKKTSQCSLRRIRWFVLVVLPVLF